MKEVKLTQNQVALAYNKIKLYQVLTEKQMSAIIPGFKHICLTEILDESNGLYGDFLVIDGYKFKSTYGSYQCLETPTEKIEKNKINFKKAINDHYRK